MPTTKKAAKKWAIKSGSGRSSGITTIVTRGGSGSVSERTALWRVGDSPKSTFRTPRFRKAVEDTFRISAAKFGVVDVKDSVIDVLAFLPVARHGKDVIKLDKTKAELAVRSVVRLAEESVKIAKDRKASQITEIDLAEAYERNFCQIWPFC